MRRTIQDLQEMKSQGVRFAMITAYDYTAAQMADRADIPVILVGDSLGMVMLGHQSTVPVTLADMVHHASAVMRGSQKALVVGDLPFLSYADVGGAVAAATQLMQRAGVQAVKLEGGVSIAPTVKRLVDFGVPVMGHLGFTPQSVNQIGVRVQARERVAARQLIDDADALVDAGAFAIVLELVPSSLAAAITRRISVPTIGIGAGPECDGQVQVWHDLLGLFGDFKPRHAKRFVEAAELIEAGLKAYATEVVNGAFPTQQHCAEMDPEELNAAISAHESRASR
jgi:3-methyl-2-oxobutanoate hydroxymethyltransferase